MSYQSIPFLLFAAAVLLVYYLLGKKQQKWVLAAANLFFYIAAGLKYLPFLLVTLLATFFSARKIGEIYREADGSLAGCTTPAEKKAVKNAAKQKAKRVLLVGMLLTIALLAVCKYTGFVLTNINDLLSVFRLPEIPLFRMILPLGISFYSFMALSYVLDVFWKRYLAEENFLNYAVYLTYFPHVVQGPINRFNEFNNQIKDGVAFDTKNLAYGAQLLLWGFFKKLVIADRIDPFVSHVFGNWSDFSGNVLLLAMLAYSVQIYADFSGCIDIVTGVSEMLGIRMRKNFNHPYFSKTMGEFWRRWHMSLQEWFKDYVYYPVSASNLLRKAKKYYNGKNRPRGAELFASCFPVLVVWLITGIWHGPSWNYVIWGIYHAILLISSQIFQPSLQKLTAKCRIRPEAWLWKFWQMARTFLLCGIGRIFFRTTTLADSFGYLGKMITGLSVKDLCAKTASGIGRLLDAGSSVKSLLSHVRQTWNTVLDINISAANICMAIAAVCVLWCADILQEKYPLRDTLAKQKIWVRWLVIFAGLFAVIIFGTYGPGFDAKSFIYEQF